ncbi:MAG: thermonuclease family protein [Bosea sp.]|uniref:thermonuclease family protein n=1 Tax=Bosea sp. (in: a-proteobacteria) TaxID=1871050 RepID=UPI002392BD5D|nr:thermonuclease family protein [Bosea sp. (in: a-proteobacteria)]MCP4738490.1 thermonuclease family protein [Bosea sp. (in: a-proteobacteria)]
MKRDPNDWAGTAEHRRELRRARLLQLSLAGSAAAFALLFGIVIAKAEPVDGDRIVIIDGDTVGLPGGERVRIFNIDAPETRGARCEAELVAGLRAKERLAQLLRGRPVEIRRCEPSGRCRDRYGRTLARLEAEGRDLGEVLVSEGRALTWATGPAARQSLVAYWCGR